MEKSIKRGVRRWRSYSKWMTRLKKDWNDHGWGTSPDGSPSCECFILTTKQAYRFKDTPTLNHSKRGCGCEEVSTARDEKRLPVEREFHGGGGRKPPPPFRKVRVQCIGCGFHMGIEVIPWAENKYRWLEARYGNRYMNRCKGCKEKARVR